MLTASAAVCAFCGFFSSTAMAATQGYCRDGKPSIEIVQVHAYEWPQNAKSLASAPAGSKLYEFDSFLVDDDAQHRSTGLDYRTQFTCDAKGMLGVDAETHRSYAFPPDVKIYKDIGAGFRILPPGSEPDPALVRQIRDGDARFVKTL